MLKLTSKTQAKIHENLRKIKTPKLFSGARNLRKIKTPPEISGFGPLIKGGGVIFNTPVNFFGSIGSEMWTRANFLARSTNGRWVPRKRSENPIYAGTRPKRDLYRMTLFFRTPEMPESPTDPKGGMILFDFTNSLSSTDKKRLWGAEQGLKTCPLAEILAAKRLLKNELRGIVHYAPGHSPGHIGLCPGQFARFTFSMQYASLNGHIIFWVGA